MRRLVVATFAWVWAGLLIVSVALAFALSLLEFNGFAAAPGPLFGLLGALLVTRRPSNPIGLLLLLTGTAYSVPIDEVIVALSATSWGEGPRWAAVLLISNIWTGLYILPIVFLLLLFPTGRVPGRRWRWLLRAGLAFSALWVLLSLSVPTLESSDGRFVVDNPLVPYTEADLMRFDTWFEGILVPLFIAALLALLLLSAVSLFVRYRGAGAVERAQVRWLLYAGFLYFTTFVLVTVAGDFGETLLGVLFTLSLLTIPIAVAIAILRHQLFDIDVIIRRTLQYGVLTVILGGLYVGSVLLFQTLLGPMIGGVESPPVVIVTTLLLAALFNPLRVRVQRFIDRRFYRRKVDAERALAEFAALARDEVDLMEIRSAMFGVVEETLQPERMGLWLRPVREGEQRG